MNEVSDAQKWLWFAASVIFCWLLYLLSPVLTPFLVAFVFAYLGSPLVQRLVDWKLSRTAAVLVVFGLFIVILALALLILIPALDGQFKYLVSRLPSYLDWIQQVALPKFAAWFGLGDLQPDMMTLQAWIKGHWQQAGSALAFILDSLSQSGLALAGWLASLLLVPVVVFYLLRDWHSLLNGIRMLLPRHLEKQVVRLASESDKVLGAFLRGQMLVMLILGVIYSIGLGIAGLRVAVLVGMLAGLLSFVPYLGVIVGLLTAAIAMLLQTHDLTQVLWVFLVFGVGQILESIVLTPLLVGDRIGLHPVAVIFAIMAGGQLFGFFGILLALPVAAVLAVILRQVHQQYLQSRVYDHANR